MKTVHIEGWRFAYHSFALVNQWQILSLLHRKDVSLTFADMPFSKGAWKTARGVFDQERENLIASIPVSRSDEARDLTPVSHPAITRVWG
jgi:hypothetical protein